MSWSKLAAVSAAIWFAAPLVCRHGPARALAGIFEN
jgi:hypothetical protein